MGRIEQIPQLEKPYPSSNQQIANRQNKIDKGTKRTDLSICINDFLKFIRE
jgi:hypothetical protein